MALLIAGHHSADLDDERTFHPDRFMRFAYELVPALRKTRVDTPGKDASTLAVMEILPITC